MSPAPARQSYLYGRKRPITAEAGMASLIYAAIASLDGYVEDEQGKFDWAAPDEEVHAFVNDLERPVGTYLYGRRMYETMVYWETVPRRSGRGGPGLRGDLACGREGRLLPDAADAVQRENPNRARVRRRGDQAAEGARTATSRSAGRSSPARRSPRAWSTSAISSSCRSSSAAASAPCRPASVPSSSCWTSAASAAASSTSATSSAADRRGPGRETVPGAEWSPVTVTRCPSNQTAPHQPHFWLSGPPGPCYPWQVRER